MTFKPMSKTESCKTLAQAASELPRSLWADRKGVTSMECALLASVLAATVLAGGAMVGTALQKSFSAVAQSFGQAARPHASSQGACSQTAQENGAQQDGEPGHAGAVACRMPRTPECLPRTVRQLP